MAYLIAYALGALVAWTWAALDLRDTYYYPSEIPLVAGGWLLEGLLWPIALPYVIVRKWKRRNQLR